jgi:peptide-methionine (S)-S-oxide reductase
MEPPYDKLSGVAKTISGFAGGSVPNPTYKQVTRGGTGHAEAVQVIYDPEQVSYEALLTVYWRNVDPLDAEGQFCDRGASYRPVIFARTARQERLAEASKAEVAERFEEEIVVPVVRETDFYAAEDYHQNYYQKEPRRYKTYRTGCRRDARLQALWGEEAGGVHLVQPEAGR